jgi:hypothetical protein
MPSHQKSPSRKRTESSRKVLPLGSR